MSTDPRPKNPADEFPSAIRIAFDLDGLKPQPDEPDGLGGMHPQFFLRRDFEIELGFESILPEPIARPTLLELMHAGARGAPLLLRRWAKDWWTRRPQPNLYLLGGFFPACPTSAINALPVVSDGRYCIHPPSDGLFSELTLRIAMTLPPGREFLVFPGRRLTPRDYKTLPTYMVVHCPVTGAAEIMRCYDAVKKVLEANGYLDRGRDTVSED